MSDTAPTDEPVPVPEQHVKEVAITEVPLENDITVVNLLIAFAQIAYKRNAYNLEEAGKLNEIIQYFKNKQ